MMRRDSFSRVKQVGQDDITFLKFVMKWAVNRVCGAAATASIKNSIPGMCQSSSALRSLLLRGLDCIYNINVINVC